MKKQILAVCDREEPYIRRLSRFLQKKDAHAFEIRAFTSRETLLASAELKEIAVLLISEKEYDASLKEQIAGEIIRLGEEQKGGEDNVQYIYKYQSCEELFREVMRYTAEVHPLLPPSVNPAVRIKMIGLYTPVHRSLQTTFGFVLGQQLAREHKVLYLNFESYSGFRFHAGKEFAADMSDLMYYFQNAREALYFRLRGMIETAGKLDYIPPAFSWPDLAEVKKEQWLDLFHELEMHTSYEYLILDLSDYMQGLFDILRICKKIFTLIKEDGMALAKVDQYERLLQAAEYEDILQKTCKKNLPYFHYLPDNLEELSRSELAEYTKKIIREELYEGR